MTTSADLRWFISEFRSELEQASSGTAFDPAFLAVIAYQETGYIWSRLRLRGGFTNQQILDLCVGDTLDAPKRRAFPRDKADLLGQAKGAEMFAIARQALDALAVESPGYRGAAKNPDKFCRGFGVFQYDLQHFRIDPDFFLQGRYKTFADSAAKCIQELKAAQGRIGWAGKSTLSDAERVAVAIAYNTGRYRPQLGLRQGYQSGGKYYGEWIDQYLTIARSLKGGAAAAAVIAEFKPDLVVDTMVSTLRLRSTPSIPRGDSTSNVLADLPDGHPVQGVSSAAIDGFLEVWTRLQGADLRGFAAQAFLKRSRSALQAEPAAAVATFQPPAAHMPRKAGTVTKRTDAANAHSLNEDGQPSRSGGSAAERRVALLGVVDWLAVETPSHRRYQPRRGATYCNIYAHDYCHLAGAYLPRVWWTGRALIRMARAEPVVARYGETIEELRANGLFRWLADFGQAFGWTRAGSLTEAQRIANDGGVALLAARRKVDGLSGHIVMIVPEHGERQAKRDVAGQVVLPLQSQAGAVNFSFGAGARAWWTDERFAEFALWTHA